MQCNYTALLPAKANLVPWEQRTGLKRKESTANDLHVLLGRLLKRHTGNTLRRTIKAVAYLHDSTLLNFIQKWKRDFGIEFCGVERKIIELFGLQNIRTIWRKKDEVFLPKKQSAYS